MRPTIQTTPNRLAAVFASLGAVSCLALMLLATPGCAATHGDADRAGRTINVSGGSLDPSTLREMGFSVRWLYDLKLAGRDGVTELEILDDLVVAVEGPDNWITALNVDSGSLRWKVVLGLDLESIYRPMRSADGERLFINSAARFFILDADNGRPVGVQALEAPVTAGGELIGDYAIFGAAKGMAFAHDVDAGYAKWRYRMTGRLVSPPVRSSENAVFLGDEAGTYVMLDVTTGSPIFRNDVFGPIVAPATVHRGDLLVPSADRTLYALDRATGNQSWTYRATAPLRQSPLSVGRDIYLPAGSASGGGGLIALDSRGNVRWESELHATPVLASDRGIYALAKNALLLLDPDTGNVLQSVRATDAVEAKPGPDGSLILRTSTGRLARLDPIR